MDHIETIVPSGDAQEVLLHAERTLTDLAEFFPSLNLSVSASCADRDRLMRLMAPFDTGNVLVDVSTKIHLVGEGFRFTSLREVLHPFTVGRYQGSIEVHSEGAILTVSVFSVQDGRGSLVLWVRDPRSLRSLFRRSLFKALGLPGDIASDLDTHIETGRALVEGSHETFHFSFWSDELKVGRSFEDWDALYGSLAGMGEVLVEALPKVRGRWFPAVRLSQLPEVPVQGKRVFFLFNYGLQEYWKMRPKEILELLPGEIGDMPEGERLLFRWSTLGELAGAPFDALNIGYHLSVWSLGISGESRRKLRVAAERIKVLLGLS